MVSGAEREPGEITTCRRPVRTRVSTSTLHHRVLVLRKSREIMTKARKPLVKIPGASSGALEQDSLKPKRGLVGASLLAIQDGRGREQARPHQLNPSRGNPRGIGPQG